MLVRSLVEAAGLWARECQDAPSSVVRTSWNVVAPAGALRSTQDTLNGMLPETPTVRRATVKRTPLITGVVGSMATAAVALDRALPSRSVALITQR